MFGVLCIIGFPVHLIREVFSIAFVVVVMDTHLPPFEALAYVLPHFDELTHVVISCVLKRLLRSFILSS